MSKFHIICVIGTRPEALKMLPLIEELSKFKLFQVKILLTGQHTDLIESILIGSKIRPDNNFNVLVKDQTLGTLNASLLTKFEHYLQRTPCDLLIAQGDTMSTMAAALTAFYQNIPFAHIEAGLRTSDMHNPFPEEFNRKIVSMAATLHFCPTELAKKNLHHENITRGVFVTGNTIIDLVKKYIKRLPKIPVFSPHTPRKTLLVTCHRRENFGKPLYNICMALKEIAKKYPDVDIIFPVHPNPNVKTVIELHLQSIPNIKLIKPLNYSDLITVLHNCYLVLTDSGGLQEEAPALNKPLLILRDHTERQEGVMSGVARLVGTQTQDILKHVDELLTHSDIYQKMIQPGAIYGDGNASQRIANLIYLHFTQRVKTVLSH